MLELTLWNHIGGSFWWELLIYPWSFQIVEYMQGAEQYSYSKE